MICAGKAKLTASSSQGRSVIVRLAGAGEILGLSAVLSGTPYEVSAETLQATEVNFLPQEEFLRFLRRYGEVSARMAQYLSQELQRAYHQVARIALAPTAKAKLAGLLVDWARSENSSRVDSASFHLWLTHEEIGQLIGASRETVTRLLSQFRRQGLIKTNGSLQITEIYTDHGISGARAKRPALDRLLRDARQGRFDVVLVWASDRLARSTRHFLEVVDELTHLNIEFVSFREQLDTGGPLGRAITVIIGAIAELERNLIIERVKAGLRRAKIEDRRLGRPPLAIDRAALLRDRQRGMTLSELAKAHGISRGSVSRVLREAKNGSQPAGTKTCPQARLQAVESTEAEAAD